MELLIKHLRPGEHALCLTSTAFLVDTNSQVRLPSELKKIPPSWFRADLAWTVFRCHVHPKHSTIKIIDNLLLFNSAIQDSSIRRWICVMAASQFGCSLEADEQKVEVDIIRPNLKFTDIKLSGDMFTKHNLSNQFTNRKVTDEKLQTHLQKHLHEIVGDILDKNGPIDHVLANLSLTNDPNVFTWIKRTSNEDRGFLLLLTQQQGKNISFLVSSKLEFFLLSKVDLPRHWWKQSVFVCLFNGKVNVVDLLSSNGIRYDKHGMIRDMMCRVFVTQASRASPWIGLQPRFENLPVDDHNFSDVWFGLVQNSSQYSISDSSTCSSSE
jgi:hypothetical protein